MTKQKQVKQAGYRAHSISLCRLCLMLNFTRTRTTFSFLTTKWKQNSRLVIGRRGKLLTVSLVQPHRTAALRRPGVIVQLEFTSSPRGGDDSRSQPFRKWGTKNYISKNVLPHIHGFLNGNSLLGILEWIWRSPVLHKPRRCETLLQAQ